MMKMFIENLYSPGKTCNNNIKRKKEKRT